MMTTTLGQRWGGSQTRPSDEFIEFDEFVASNVASLGSTWRRWGQRRVVASNVASLGSTLGQRWGGSETRPSGEFVEFVEFVALIAPHPLTPRHPLAPHSIAATAPESHRRSNHAASHRPRTPLHQAGGARCRASRDACCTSWSACGFCRLSVVRCQVSGVHRSSARPRQPPIAQRDEAARCVGNRLHQWVGLVLRTRGVGEGEGLEGGGVCVS